MSADRPLPIQERVRAAWRPGMGYHELLAAVFPPDQFPRAFRAPNRGGPPGCAMAFSRALRALGAHEGPYPARVIWLPPQTEDACSNT